MKTIVLVLLGGVLAVLGISYLKTNAQNSPIPTNYAECRRNTESNYDETTCKIAYVKTDTNATACLDTGGCITDAVEGSAGCTMVFFNPDVQLPTNNLECTKLRRGRGAETLGTVNDLSAGCELTINTSCAGNSGESKAIIDKCPENNKTSYNGYSICELKFK